MATHSLAKSYVAVQLCRQRKYGSDDADGPDDRRLEVFVVFTNRDGTLAALEMANRLTERLSARLRLIRLFEVPYSLPLDQPGVQVEFLERELSTLAGQALMEVSAQIFLCRDKQRALQSVMRSGAPVILGGRKRWWPTPEQRLAQALARAGHHVIFAELR
jgi:hypothetical protein